ncbi:TetR/AcrR family transcriptional regulator [Gallaecimonas kandeliae]|uniref:TetR/AcrR family transcriptional regulator n=1 Tax=Gallaecimonas kandeliae TaxID=3029055 RepID=UPI0026499A84|nr:TetR/AcrR family transcriptional regulator [Gallaecimonas kandeliae]WKE67339.1 TetR/AcrR family transcriptional regulator [Gallaecimonas kandeliae]
MKKRNTKRQTILETAYRLFRNKGFDATSVSEISAEVGGSKATIYNHFPSKEVLFVECMMAATEDYISSIIALLDQSEKDPEALLRNFGDSFLSFVASSRWVAVQRLLIAEADRSGIGKLFFAKLTALRGHVEVFLEQLMASGVLRRDDPRLAASHLRALLEAEILEPLLLQATEVAPGEQEIRQAADRAVTTFIRAYAPAG